MTLKSKGCDECGKETLPDNKLCLYHYVKWLGDGVDKRYTTG